MNTRTEETGSIVQQRKRKLALDHVAAGDDKATAGKVDKKLPGGITSTMLYSDVVRIAWPSLIELTLTQLTSMADLMMVGSLGPWAITAVGLTMQPKNLLMTMFMAMNVGATALVARYRGAGKPDKANEILRQALLLTFGLSSLASVLGYVYSENLVRFMGAAEDAVLGGGTTYLRIQMLGFVPMALTTTITATLRGVGNTRVAMIYNLISNAVNVVLNYLLIHGHLGFPRLELVGASLATIIGQTVAFLLALIVVLRGDQYLRLRLKDGFKPIWRHLRNIFDIGVPAMLEQSVMRVGNIVFVKTIAGLGTAAYATHQVSMNIQALSFMSGQAFAVSATSLVGQSLGKRRPDMAENYSNHTRHLGMILAFFLAGVFYFFGDTIISFYSSDPEIVAEGARVLKLVALIQPFQSSQFVLTGALRGAGDTRATALIVFATVFIVRPGLAWVHINKFGWGLIGAWSALVVGQVLRSILISLRYRSGKWKYKRFV